jgi:hypothetical protein
MTTTLYVVGNGFDLHHGIPSAYKDFGGFVKAYDRELYGLIEMYFAVDDEFWSDFEARLAEFDDDALIEESSNFLVSYGAEDWSDSAHHDYQVEVDRVVRALSVGLKAAFAQWIRRLAIPDPSAIPLKLLRLDTGATFLTFNYTASLTAIYGIGRSRVVHIHGDAAAADAELILGHAWAPDHRGTSEDTEDADTRVAEGNLIIDRYFEQTFKPTAQIIAAHRSFFEGLRGTQQVIVMGHRIADVDLPSFEEVVRHVDAANTRWRISYYRDSDIPDLRLQFGKLGVPENLVDFVQLTDI